MADTDLENISTHMSPFNLCSHSVGQPLASFQSQENQRWSSRVLAELRFVSWYLGLMPTLLHHIVFQIQSLVTPNWAFFHQCNLLLTMHEVLRNIYQNGCVEKHIYSEIIINAFWTTSGTFFQVQGNALCNNKTKKRWPAQNYTEVLGEASAIPSLSLPYHSTAPDRS